MTDTLIKTGHGDPHKNEDREWGDAATRQRTTKFASKPPEAGERPDIDSLY